MLDEVLSNKIDDTSNVETIMKSLGIKVMKGDDDFIKECTNLLGMVNTMNYAPRFYRVINTTTQAAFDAGASKTFGSEVVKLWHGSRTSNWLGIVSNNGLQPKYPGAHNTGSMFGAGAYFANKAMKAYGYTSADDAIWTNGDPGGRAEAEKVDAIYFGLYQVRLGKTWIVNFSYSAGYQ